jgi:hypothetical protein
MLSKSKLSLKSHVSATGTSLLSSTIVGSLDNIFSSFKKLFSTTVVFALYIEILFRLE